MGPWIVLYAVGAVQAAMLAPLLWRRTANAAANRVLGFWLAVIAADLAIKALHLADPGEGPVADAYRIARLLPFAYAPLFLVYVRSLTTGRAPGPGAWRHAAWFLLMLGWMGWHWLAGHQLSASGSWDARWFDWLLLLVAFAYLAAAVVGIRRYRRWLRAHRADADRLSLRWLGVMTGCQFVVWGIAAAHALMHTALVDYRTIFAGVAAWVCVVGWFSQGQPPVVVAQEGDAEGARATASSAAAPGAADDPRFDDVETRLSALMQGEGLYREPALTIAQLARRSGYPEYLVSAVINRRLGGNFWDYVNRHRVEAVRARLADPGEARSILDIAYDAGFTSKSTFNAAFKRLVGETPSAWRRRHAEAGALAGTSSPPPSSQPGPGA